jgi:hypothetical protein
MQVIAITALHATDLSAGLEAINKTYRPFSSTRLLIALETVQHMGANPVRGKEGPESGPNSA